MGIVAMRLSLSAILVLGTVLVGCPGGPAQEPTEAEQRVAALERDIQLLQEFNRLELTKDELTRLIEVVEEIQAFLDERETHRLDVLSRLTAQLEARREALLRDEPVPLAVSGQIEELRAELLDLDENTEQELLAKFALPIKQVLRPQQVDILTWIGEARAQAIGYLEWAREMTDEEFSGEAGIVAESLAEGRDITADKILEVLRTARELSATEYTAGQTMLADKLLPAVRDEDVPEDLVLVQRMRPPELLPLLREKLARLP
jgi:hypothetical protein